MRLGQYLTEATSFRNDGVRINTALRQKINKQITKMTSNKTFKHIPLTDIFDIFKSFDYKIVDEAGDDWSGFLTGAQGEAHFDIATKDGVPVNNIKLHMTWYKYETGNYEIVCYAM
jgi:hypothetical protein